MAMADDDYRKRLAASMQAKNKTSRELAFSSPPPPVNAMKPWFGLPGTNKFPWQAKNVSEAIGSGLVGIGGVALSKLLYDPAEANRRALAQSQGMGMEALNDPNNPNTRMIMESAMPGGGVGSTARKATLAALRSKALQEAVKSAEEFAGTKFADEVLGQGTMKATDMPRYAQAGGQKFLDFIEEQLASGAMDVKSANRFVRAFPEYLKGSGADAAYEIVGRNARAFEDLTTKADDALVEMQFAKEGLSKGTRKYGPKTLAEHLLSKLPEAQARVYGVLDEWY